jgi:predicted metalloprotease with PDZ domain
MKKIFIAIIAAVIVNFPSSAQHPLKHWMDAIDLRYDANKPVINYMLTIDPSDFSFMKIEMKIKNVEDRFQLAMVTHPEYDDQYWRYVEDLSVRGKTAKGVITRSDSATWNVQTNGREATIQYKIRFPKTEGIRSSWKAYLTPTGGLVGGPHSFMYVTGATLAPSFVTVNMPAGWEIVTGLQSTLDKNIFLASSIFTLTDDPIFVGKFRSWSFNVDNIPHRLIYWPLHDTTSFDAETLVSSVKKIVEQAVVLFGRLPYRDFVFMLQDGAVGSLEHNNSVTVGAPGSSLARNVHAIMPEIVHEYFHSWNLVRIHPVEYGDVDHKKPPLSKGLWFSEGLTIFYSDLLLRRAGIPVFDTTRSKHLENLIRRYSINPAYQKFSAEKISESAYGDRDMLGNYSGSTHLQGELLGALMDFIIRDATNGSRSIDDVMRLMMKKFSGEKGFTSADIQKTVEDICGCRMDQFFRDYVFGSKPIDFTKYLRLIGLQYSIEWKDVVSNEGVLIPDLRVFSYSQEEGGATRIGITNPTGCWAKSGLNTGDIIKTVNGTKITGPDFRSFIRNARIGDRIIIQAERNGKDFTATVHINSYQSPFVTLSSLADATEKQKRLYQQWVNGQ